jgi:hypothetical protein
MDLRCEGGKKFGELLEPHTVEFKCRSPRCGHQPGVVVLHRFDAVTGVLLETTSYREPRKETA